MPDLRKLLLALAVVAIVSLPAFAQIVPIGTPLNCVAQAAGTPSIRAEGVTELVGDVLIICNGGQPTDHLTPLRQVNIQVFSSPSINITSRILANDWVESLLFIDEPTPAEQTVCGSSAAPESVPDGSGQPVITGVCGDMYGTNPAFVNAPATTYKPSTPGYGGQRPNVFQGRRVGNNSIIWQGIPFDAPGTQTTRIMRITNVRVNASQLGVPSGSQASVSLVISTSASGVLNPIAVPITNPAPTVAIAQPSLAFFSRDLYELANNRYDFLQCRDENAANANDLANNAASTRATTSQIELRYEELFPTVFRRRNIALAPSTGDFSPTPQDQDTLGVIYQTETGFYKNVSTTQWPLGTGNSASAQRGNLNLAGLADHGTRVIARFTNVPAGVQIWVRTNPVIRNMVGVGADTGVARLVNTDANGNGPFSAVNVGNDGSAVTPLNGGAPSTPILAGSSFKGIAQVALVGNTGQAVWEIMNTDTTAFERLPINVVIAYKANTTNNLPAIGTANVNGALAPISTVATASSTASVPRFIDAGIDRVMFAISKCATNLLFPFVTNVAPFDTGLAISNTSKDPFGTPLQSGICKVNSYGKIGDSAVTLANNSPSLTGGEHIVWSLSSGGAVAATPGFQGYLIAQCEFQYAHGYAFISDLGAQRLAQGYLALVMDSAIASRTGSQSEVLGH